MIDMPRRTKEKLLEHFGKSKPDFFGISYISLEEGIVLQSRMVDNYIRFLSKLQNGSGPVGRGNRLENGWG